MKIRNILLFGVILSLSFSGCGQKNLKIVNINNKEIIYQGYYDFKTKQLNLTEGVSKFKSFTPNTDLTKLGYYPSTKMIINDPRNPNCGIIIKKSKSFSTTALVQKDDVRTSGVIKLDDKNSLMITVDEEYMIGEAKDQNGKCYKVLLTK